MSQKVSNRKPGRNGIRFVTEFKHWRTGKIMRAADYGHKAWPLGKRRG